MVTYLIGCLLFLLGIFITDYLFDNASYQTTTWGDLGKTLLLSLGSWFTFVLLMGLIIKEVWDGADRFHNWWASVKHKPIFPKKK